MLAELTPSPVLQLSRAVALAMADGPAAGLELVADLEAPARCAAIICCRPPRATCSGALGRTAQAAASYRETLELAAIDAERRYLDHAEASQARPPPDPVPQTLRRK